MARKPRRGRPESSSLIRRVLSLVAGLEHEGDTINVEGVQERFGVDEAEARRTIQLIIGAAYNGNLSLPIRISEDGSSLSLAFDSAVTGKPVRLTLAETEAIRRAMDLMGFDDESAFRRGVERAFAAGSAVSAAHLVQLEDDDQAESLRVIAEALEEATSLAFTYRGSDDAQPTRRRVVPIDIRHENDAWYLDAEDLDRCAFRTFRVDRMVCPEKTLDVESIVGSSSIREFPFDGMDPDADGNHAEDVPRMVRLAFSDPFYLEHLDWPGFVEESRGEDGRVVGSIPYFGGSWLLRHVAACCGTVEVLDASFAEELQGYVRGLLDR